MKAYQTEQALLLLERLARIINNDAGSSDIKPAQWEALRFFSQANRFSRTPSALTAYLGVTKGSVSQTINALERKGYLMKATEPGDRRSVNIELTVQGRALLKNNPLQALLPAMDKMNMAELKTFNTTLRGLLTEALTARAGRPFGVCKTCRFFKRNAVNGNPHRCGLLDVPLSVDDSELICREHERVTT